MLTCYMYSSKYVSLDLVHGRYRISLEGGSICTGKGHYCTCTQDASIKFCDVLKIHLLRAKSLGVLLSEHSTCPFSLANVHDLVNTIPILSLEN